VFVHIGRGDRRASLKPGAGRAGGRSFAPHRDPRQPLGDPPVARGVARGAWHPCGAEGLAGRARPAAVRLLASQADDGRRNWPRSRRWPTRSSCRTPGRPADHVDDAPFDPAPWRCSARNTATRCASCRWARRTRRRRRARPIRSSCAAAPMSPPPARSAWCGWCPKRGRAGVRRIEALTGDAARQHLSEQDEKLRRIAAQGATR
jgi:hypothetical protein